MQRNLILALALLTFLVSMPLLAEVYKSTDAEGNVIYTDRPPSKDAEAVDIPPPTTYKPAAIPKAPSTQSKKAPQGFSGYKSVRINSPEDESTFRDPSGKLELTVVIEPTLQPGHKVRILMDSEQKAEGISTSFSFENLDRGAHIFQAFVIDTMGRPVGVSDPVTVYVHRPSVLIRKRSGG